MSNRNICWLRKIQSFQFDIYHIHREQNVVADALSMYPHPEVTIPTGVHTMSINSILGGAAPVLLILPLVKENNNEDSYCKKQLATPDSDHIRVADGFLHRISPKGQTLVVPRIEAVTAPLLKYAHDDCGHLGIGKTKARLMNLCYWKGMHTDIVTHITHCGVCQESCCLDLWCRWISRLDAGQIER